MKTDEKDSKFSTENKSLFHDTVLRAYVLWRVFEMLIHLRWKLLVFFGGVTICHKLDPYLLLHQRAAQTVP